MPCVKSCVVVQGGSPRSSVGDSLQMELSPTEQTIAGPLPLTTHLDSESILGPSTRFDAYIYMILSNSVTQRVTSGGR